MVLPHRKHKIARPDAVPVSVWIALAEGLVVHRSVWRRQGNAVAWDLDVLDLRPAEIPRAPPGPLTGLWPAKLPGLLGHILGKLPIIVDVQRLRPNIPAALPQTPDLLQIIHIRGIDNHMVVDPPVLQGPVLHQPVVGPFFVVPLCYIDILQLRAPFFAGRPEPADKPCKVPIGRFFALREVVIIIGMGQDQSPAAEVSRHHQLQLPPGALVIVKLLGRRGGLTPGRPPLPAGRTVRDRPNDLNVEQSGPDVLDCLTHPHPPPAGPGPGG